MSVFPAVAYNSDTKVPHLPILTALPAPHIVGFDLVNLTHEDHPRHGSALISSRLSSLFAMDWMVLPVMHAATLSG